MSYTIGVPLGPHVLYIGVPFLMSYHGTFRSYILYIGVPLGPHVLYIGVPLGPHVLYHRGTFRSSCPIP